MGLWFAFLSLRLASFYVTLRAGHFARQGGIHDCKYPRGVSTCAQQLSKARVLARVTLEVQWQLKAGKVTSGGIVPVAGLFFYLLGWQGQQHAASLLRHAPPQIPSRGQQPAMSRQLQTKLENT